MSTEIFETDFHKLSVSFDFEPEFSEILVEWNAPIKAEIETQALLVWVTSRP